MLSQKVQRINQKPVSQWALQVFNAFRASSLSPLDSSQNAYNLTLNLSLRVNIGPQTNVVCYAYLLVQITLVMYTGACTPVGPP
eukprot:2883634-Heterocapsa_arctica.AAC.1